MVFVKVILSSFDETKYFKMHITAAMLDWPGYAVRRPSRFTCTEISGLVQRLIYIEGSH